MKKALILGAVLLGLSGVGFAAADGGVGGGSTTTKVVLAAPVTSVVIGDGHCERHQKCPPTLTAAEASSGISFTVTAGSDSFTLPADYDGVSPVVAEGGFYVSDGWNVALDFTSGSSVAATYGSTSYRIVTSISSDAYAKLDSRTQSAIAAKYSLGSDGKTYVLSSASGPR